MATQTTFLCLPDEIIEQVLSYLTGIPKVRNAKHVYPSPNIDDWEDLPHRAQLLALAKSCSRLYKLTQHHVYSMAGVHPHTYWDELRLILALKDSSAFSRQIKHLSVRLEHAGVIEKIAIVGGCSNLQSLEWILPSDLVTDSSVCARIGAAARNRWFQGPPVTLRLSFPDCIINSAADASSLLRFISRILHTFTRYYPKLRCLQLVGLYHNAHSSEAPPPPIRNSRLQEVVLRDSLMPLPFWSQLIATVESPSLSRLRLDKVLVTARAQGNEGQGDEDGDGPIFAVFLSEALRVIPINIRRQLQSLDIIEYNDRKEVDPEGTVNVETPLFPALSHVGLGPLDLLPLLAETAASVLVSTPASIGACCKTLDQLAQHLEAGHFTGIKQIPFHIAKGYGYGEGTGDERLEPSEVGHTEPEATRGTWGQLEKTFQRYSNAVGQRSIPICVDLQLWVERKRALRRVMERSEMENEPQEDEGPYTEIHPYDPSAMSLSRCQRYAPP